MVLQNARKSHRADPEWEGVCPAVSGQGQKSPQQAAHYMRVSKLVNNAKAQYVCSQDKKPVIGEDPLSRNQWTN